MPPKQKRSRTTYWYDGRDELEVLGLARWELALGLKERFVLIDQWSKSIKYRFQRPYPPTVISALQGDIDSLNDTFVDHIKSLPEECRDSCRFPKCDLPFNAVFDNDKNDLPRILLEERKGRIAVLIDGDLILRSCDVWWNDSVCSFVKRVEAQLSHRPNEVQTHIEISASRNSSETRFVLEASANFEVMVGLLGARLRPTWGKNEVDVPPNQCHWSCWRVDGTGATLVADSEQSLFPRVGDVFTVPEQEPFLNNEKIWNVFGGRPDTFYQRPDFELQWVGPREGRSKMRWWTKKAYQFSLRATSHTTG